MSLEFLAWTINVSRYVSKQTDVARAESLEHSGESDTVPGVADYYKKFNFALKTMYLWCEFLHSKNLPFHNISRSATPVALSIW